MTAGLHKLAGSRTSNGIAQRITSAERAYLKSPDVGQVGVRTSVREFMDERPDNATSSPRILRQTMAESSECLSSARLDQDPAAKETLAIGLHQGVAKPDKAKLAWKLGYSIPCWRLNPDAKSRPSPHTASSGATVGDGKPTGRRTDSSGHRLPGRSAAGTRWRRRPDSAGCRDCAMTRSADSSFSR
jgi:hypothetical protein